MPSESESRHRGHSHRHNTDSNKRRGSKSPDSKRARYPKTEYYEDGPSGPDATLALEPGINDTLKAVRKSSAKPSPPSPPEMPLLDDVSEILQMPNITPADPKCPYCSQIIETNRLGPLSYAQHLLSLHIQHQSVVKEVREWAWKFDNLTSRGKRQCRLRKCGAEFRDVGERDKHECDAESHGSKFGTPYPCKYRHEGCFASFTRSKGLEEHLLNGQCLGQRGQMIRNAFSDENNVRKMAPRKTGDQAKSVPPTTSKSSGSGGSKPLASKPSGSGSMPPSARPSGSSRNSKDPQQSGSSSRKG